ncbi:uncharacterized protein LOC110892627 [Helianthus annuus]|uniref:uncharacterized protein LOC110892627 n=1 Tax=Helianthus annuus TaxID=4232 RepID=UPI000B8FB8A0|nr:uncharacterized protein LOC110892627 [Helianthus annuus]
MEADSDLQLEVNFQWNSWAPIKCNYLLWRAISGKVAAKLSLLHRGINLDNLCCDRCGYGLEDPDHIFAGCIWARSVWWQVAVWMRIPPPIDATSLKEAVKLMTSNTGSAKWKKIVYTVVLASVWRIWRVRNLMVFEGVFVPIRRIVDLIKEDAFLWISHRSKLPNPDWDNWLEFNVVNLL